MRISMVFYRPMYGKGIHTTHRLMTQVNEGRKIEYMTLKSNKIKSYANFRTKYGVGQALVCSSVGFGGHRLPIMGSTWGGPSPNLA